MSNELVFIYRECVDPQYHRIKSNINKSIK